MNSSGPHLVFATSEGRYAVAADMVRQVRALPVLERDEDLRGGWVGVAHLEDEPLHVVDVDLVVGREPEPYTLDHRVVDVEVGDEPVGLVAADVEGIVPLDEEDRLPTPAEGPVEIVVEAEGRRVGVLDVAALVRQADAAEPAVSPGRLFEGFDDEELAELARRQRDMMGPSGGGPAEADRVAVLAEAGGARLALQVDEVERFVRFDFLTPVPSTSDHVVGLANHRGEIVTVLDAAPVVGRRERGPPGSALAALLDEPGGLIAVAVDEVGQTIAVDEDGVEPPSSPRRGLVGSIRHEGELIPLVDPSALADRDATLAREA